MERSLNNILDPLYRIRTTKEDISVVVFFKFVDDEDIKLF